MSIKPGTYKGAKIKDYGFTQKEGKTPSVMVQFEFEDEGRTKEISWFGSFNGGARKYTVDTLVKVLGYEGTDGSDIAAGSGSKVLKEDREYDLVIDDNTYNNVTRSQVKFINIAGQTRQVEKLAKDKAPTIIGGMNLAGDFLSVKSTLPNNPESEEDVPF